MVDAVPDHGGGLARAEARFGRPADGWLDLSTGINPWPYPIPPLPAEAWTRLPDRDAVEGLLASAARYLGVADPSLLVAAPGSQALIQQVPRLFPRGRTAILGFTYAEHARCWRLAGHSVTSVADLAEAEGFDHAVVVNPNNPDGRRVPPPALLDLAGRFAARGGTLIVDEAFADVDPDVSVASAAGRDGLLVLRSFGKFFGLAGVRLGIAAGPRAMLARLDAEFGPWAVAGPALEIGRVAMDDAAWIAATRARLDAAAVALDELLDRYGLPVIGGTSLYRLVHTPHAPALFRALGARGILVRAFDAHPDRLRFGLPPDAAASRRLTAAIPAA